MFEIITLDYLWLDTNTLKIPNLKHDKLLSFLNASIYPDLAFLMAMTRNQTAEENYQCVGGVTKLGG